MRGDTLPFFSTGLANFGVTSNFLSMQECFWALIQWTHAFCGFEPNFLIAPLDNTQPGFSQFRHDPLSRGQYGGVRHTWGRQITSLICGLPSIALFRVGMTSSAIVFCTHVLCTHVICTRSFVDGGSVLRR